MDAAKKFESAIHRDDREKKSATWLLKAAKDADLALDDNMQAQIKETLGSIPSEGGSKKRNRSEVVAPIDVLESGGSRQKTLSKVQQLKKKYEDLKKAEGSKKFSNSSFITPEAASYLNELIKENQSRADLEIVYAG